MAVAPVATGSPLGRLDKTVDRLQDAVADAGIEPVQYPVPVVHDRVRKALEGFEPTAAVVDAMAPVGEAGLGQFSRLLPELVEFELELVGPGQVAMAPSVPGEGLALAVGEPAGPLQPEVVVFLSSGWERCSSRLRVSSAWVNRWTTWYLSKVISALGKFASMPARKAGDMSRLNSRT